MKENVKRQTDAMINKNIEAGEMPRLLLHSCCAPCSSSVMEYLRQGFKIDILFYNPNITDEQEYRRRLEEQKNLLGMFNKADCDIGFRQADYDPEEYLKISRGLENEPEGGARCKLCFKLRLDYAAKQAKAGAYDFFATTLTLSPLKKAELINEIGQEAAAVSSTQYLSSDFKKGGGYLRSVELSREYGLYRQNFCGCEFSKRKETSD